MKTLITSAFIIATIALGAQNTKQKKACIKMESDENGKVVKIDTCVYADTDEELQQKINALGLGAGLPPLPALPPAPPDAPGAPEIVIVTDSLPGGGKEITCTKVIVIDDGEDEGTGSKKAGKGKQVKIISNGTPGNGTEEVIVMDEKGNVITSDKHPQGKMRVQHLKPGEKMDPEVEKMLKEHGMEGDNTTGKRIVIKNQENKNGKESSEVKVYVFSKVEVKKLSDEDKKQLPVNASKAIQNAKPFENLNVAPNPTEDACTISYKSASKEPLQIKVYDMEGKTVLAENDTNASDQVNKTISLKGLGSGVYFVHITQGKQSEVRKVIVK